MKLKFETFFRGFVVLFVVLLFWTMWANAQETNSTNTVTVTTNAPAKPVETLIKIPQFGTNDALLTFYLDRVPRLKPDFHGQPRWKYLASLVYIILAFYVSKLFDFLTRVWLKKLAQRTSTKLDDLLLELLNGPVKIISFVIFLHIGLSIFTWPETIEQLFIKALNLTVVACFVYVLLKGIDLSVGLWKIRTSTDDNNAFNEQLFPIIRKSLKLFVLIVAFLFVCDNVFHYNIKTILASLSIGGLALGLAAQDTLSNFFGAVVVFVDKPFRVGDRIQLDQVDGTVESIGLRSTRVRNLDGHLITVPNKTMGNATITNITCRPNIKSTINIGITYDTPAPKVKRAIEILTELFKPHPMTHDLIISFNQFNDSALNIMIVHWWNSTDFKAYLAGMQEINLQIKERFDAEKISFAFPSRTIYLKQDSEWRIGQPPEVKEEPKP
ncbi:MAG: mechanosensitive ion channel family protein [Verrucomicrobiota bacterium]